MQVNYSLKGLFKFSVVFVILALLVVGVASLIFLHRAIDTSDALVEDSLEEMRMSMGLQLALSKVAMPPNDHIIHADQQEQANYQSLSESVDAQFLTFSARSQLPLEQRMIMEKARSEWLEARTIGNQIMSLKNPIADVDAAAQMELFDSHLDQAIVEITAINQAVQQGIAQRHDYMHHLRITASIFIFVVFLSGLSMAIIGGITLSRAFFPSLAILSGGLQRCSKGEFGFRIVQKMPAEFQDLATGFNTMAGKLQAMQEKLENDSIRDVMTGCYNHRKFTHDIRHEVSRAKRYRKEISLLILDIDYFKEVNDSYGHMAGDEVLRAITREITSLLRDSDTLYRYGGDEFTVILGETREPEARIAAERLREAIANKRVNINRETVLRVTASMGIAFFPRDAESEEGLMRNADQALYRAKASGRNRVCHVKDKCEPRLTEVKSGKTIN